MGIQYLDSPDTQQQQPAPAPQQAPSFLDRLGGAAKAVGNFVAPAASTVSQVVNSPSTSPIKNFLTNGTSGATQGLQDSLDVRHHLDQQILQMAHTASASGNKDKAKKLLALIGQNADQIGTVEDAATGGQGYQSTGQAIGNFALTGLNALSGGGLAGGAMETGQLAEAGNGLKAMLAAGHAAPAASAIPEGANLLQKIGTTAKNLAPAAGRVAQQAVGGGLYNGATALQNNASPEDIAQAIKSGASVSALLSSGLEAASILKGVGRAALGKTAVGQVFGNPSSDVMAGITGKNSAPAYEKLLTTADQKSPQGIAGAPIVQAAQTVLGGNPEGSGLAARGFGIKGSGPAGLYAVHPEDQAIMQHVIDFANGKASYKDPATAAAELQQAKDLATAYGLDVKQPGSSLSNKITNGINNAFSVRKYQNGTIVSPTEASQALAKAFQPVLENGGHLPLNFTNTAFANRAADQATINTLWQDIGKTAVGGGSQGGANTVINLDTLKQRIGEDIKSAAPGSQLKAVLTGMQKAVQQPLREASPQYNAAMQSYQGYKAGQQFNPILPQGKMAALEGGGGALAAALHPSLLTNPYALAGVAASSPRVQGLALRGGGAANRVAGKAVVPLAQTLKNSPVGIAEALKALGITP